MDHISSLAIHVSQFARSSASSQFCTFISTVKTSYRHIFHICQEQEQFCQLLPWIYSILLLWLSAATHHTCCILSLGKQSDSDSVFWLWAAIMSPGRWSRSGWGSGRRLLPGRGSCRLSRETWSNRPRPVPAGPATSQTLRRGNRRSIY